MRHPGQHNFFVRVVTLAMMLFPLGIAVLLLCCLWSCNAALEECERKAAGLGDDKLGQNERLEHPYNNGSLCMLTRNTLASFLHFNPQTILNGTKIPLCLADFLDCNPIARHLREHWLLKHCFAFITKPLPVHKTAADREKRAFLDGCPRIGLFKGSRAAPEMDDVLHHVICRTAFQMAAPMLSSGEVSWLLRHLPNVIYNNQRLLNELPSYEMFTEEHVLFLQQKTCYNWPSNPRAFETLPASSILRLLESCSFSLTKSGADMLLTERVRHRLVNDKRLSDDYRMWMVPPRGDPLVSRLFRPELLVRAIETHCSNDKIVNPVVLDSHLHVTLLAFYVHFELETVRVLEGIVSAFFDVVRNFQEPETNFDAEVCFIYEAGGAFKELLRILDARSSVIRALVGKFEDQNGAVSGIIALLKTPLTSILRLATIELKTDIEEIQLQFKRADTWNHVLYHRLLATCQAAQRDSSEDSTAPIAFDPLIALLSNTLAVAQLCGSAPAYESTFSEVALSPLGMERLWREAGGFGYGVENLKWTRMFFFQQSDDFAQLQRRGASFETTGTREEMVAMLLRVFASQVEYAFSSEELAHLRDAWGDDVRMSELVGIFEATPDYLHSKSFKFVFKAHFHTCVASLIGTEQVLCSLPEPNHTLFCCAKNKASAKAESLLATLGETISEEWAAELATPELAELLNLVPEALSRAQIKSLLRTGAGRRLLAANLPLLHGLRTYEDMTVEDLREFSLSADFAQWKWTLSWPQVLDFLKRPGQHVNMPSELVWGLNQSVLLHPKLLPHSRRLFSFDALVRNRIQLTAGGTDAAAEVDWIALTVGIVDSLETRKESLSDGEIIYTVLRWLIQMEDNFFIFHMLYCVNPLLSVSVKELYERVARSEHVERQKLAQFLQERLNGKKKRNDLRILSQLLTVPLSTLHAGAILIAGKVLRSVTRTSYYESCHHFNSTFSEWIARLGGQIHAEADDAVAAVTDEFVRIAHEINSISDTVVRARQLVLDDVTKSIDICLELVERHAARLSPWEQEHLKQKLRVLNILSADMATINPGRTRGWFFNLMEEDKLSLYEKTQVIRSFEIGGIPMYGCDPRSNGVPLDTPLVSPPACFSRVYSAIPLEYIMQAHSQTSTGLFQMAHGKTGAHGNTKKTLKKSPSSKK